MSQTKRSWARVLASVSVAAVDGESTQPQQAAMSGSARSLAFSVSIHDCEVQTFRSGGKGGQNQNKRDTGVRVIHHPSGARGESREERSQLQNKKAAFARMVDDPKFRVWTNRMLFHAGVSPEQKVEKDMAPANLKIEGRDGEDWVEIS